MLNGKCCNCGNNYLGWALTEVRHQTCAKCGSALVVREYGKVKLPNSVRRELAIVEEGSLAGCQNKVLH